MKGPHWSDPPLRRRVDLPFATRQELWIDRSGVESELVVRGLISPDIPRGPRKRRWVNFRLA